MANTKKTPPKTSEGPTYVTLISGIKDAPAHVAAGETAKEYQKGDDVSHWAADRLESAIKRGLVGEDTLTAPEATESDTDNDTDDE